MTETDERVSGIDDELMDRFRRGVARHLAEEPVSPRTSLDYNPETWAQRALEHPTIAWDGHEVHWVVLLRGRDYAYDLSAAPVAISRHAKPAAKKLGLEVYAVKAPESDDPDGPWREAVRDDDSVLVLFKRPSATTKVQPFMQVLGGAPTKAINGAAYVVTDAP